MSLCLLRLVVLLVCPHQEPVDVHEQQGQQQSIEEEVEGDVGDSLDAGHTCGIQHFQREPVETKPKPGRVGRGGRTWL